MVADFEKYCWSVSSGSFLSHWTGWLQSWLCWLDKGLAKLAPLPLFVCISLAPVSVTRMYPSRIFVLLSLVPCANSGSYGALLRKPGQWVPHVVFVGLFANDLWRQNFLECWSWRPSALSPGVYLQCVCSGNHWIGWEFWQFFAECFHIQLLEFMCLLSTGDCKAHVLGTRLLFSCDESKLCFDVVKTGQVAALLRIGWRHAAMTVGSFPSSRVCLSKLSVVMLPADQADSFNVVDLALPLPRTTCVHPWCCCGSGVVDCFCGVVLCWLCWELSSAPFPLLGALPLLFPLFKWASPLYPPSLPCCWWPLSSFPAWASSMTWRMFWTRSPWCVCSNWLMVDRRASKRVRLGFCSCPCCLIPVSHLSVVLCGACFPLLFPLVLLCVGRSCLAANCCRSWVSAVSSFWSRSRTVCLAPPLPLPPLRSIVVAYAICAPVCICYCRWFGFSGSICACLDRFPSQCFCLLELWIPNACLLDLSRPVGSWSWCLLIILLLPTAVSCLMQWIMLCMVCFAMHHIAKVPKNTSKKYIPASTKGAVWIQNTQGAIPKKPEPSETFRNLPPKPTPAHTGTLGTFRNLPPEPAPATRTGTHQLIMAEDPLACAVGEKPFAKSLPTIPSRTQVVI